MFGAKLTELRTKAGLSQGALARIAGLSRQSLTNLEADRREPTWKTVQKLALALGADVRVFIDPDVTLPDVEPKKPPGRPRKVPEAPAVAVHAETPAKKGPASGGATSVAGQQQGDPPAKPARKRKGE